jgi:large subunit ribosomal protein L19
MDQIIREVEETLIEQTDFPKFKAGDTVTIDYLIKEGGKERIQQYKGVVMQMKGTGRKMTFTVRKISGNVGVERVFPISSPNLKKIEVNKVGKVRRARVYYLRELTGKASRVKEKRI